MIVGEPNGTFNVDKFIKTLDKPKNEIETRVVYMNYYLDLLHQAMLTGNEEVAQFQREQLSIVSARLQELGYFSSLSLSVQV